LLPPPCPEQLERVRRYLTVNRQLPPALLESLIQSGSLYADARANAVFVLRGKLGQPVGAELRGTSACAWKGMAPGSRKDHGFFAVPATAEIIVLCESAIDAISCHALHPQYRCLSTAGARPDPAWLGDLVGQAQLLYCGFDSDETGEAMARSMIALYPSIQRLRPARKHWNTCCARTSLRRKRLRLLPSKRSRRLLLGNPNSPYLEREYSHQPKGHFR
jgi:hypothetical protein